MEIIVNSLLELVDRNGILTYDKVVEIIFEELGIDLLNHKDMSDEGQVNCFRKEFFVKKTSKLEGIFYLEIGYDVQFSSLDKSVDIIQHGFIPFYINGFNELSFFPYKTPEIVLKEKYRNPDLDGFKKIKIRKRKLICHYTKRDIAIEKILKNKNLRFNEIKNTNDPWEYKKNIFARSDKDSDIFEAIGKKFKIQVDSEKFKALCFTKDTKRIRCFENVLMWAHYADTHKGLCLVFDENKLWNLFKQQFHREKRFNKRIVKYQKNTDRIFIKSKENSSNVFPKFGKELFFSKNIAWKYESEYRFMIYPDENTETFLEKINEAIVAIILGMEFPKDYTINIQELHRKYFSNAKLFQMHWDTDGYFRIKDFSGPAQKCNQILNDYLIEI